jgi:hypothetical protein
MVTPLIHSRFPMRSGLAAAGLLLFTSTCRSAPIPPVAVTIGNFTGSDQRLARVVSETLFTDLAKSSRLTLIDGRERDSAAGAQSAYTLTGSCLLFDNSAIINLRVLDETGHTVPGLALNSEGSRSTVLMMIHSLASRMAARLTGGSEAPVRSAVPIHTVKSASSGLKMQAKAGFSLPQLASRSTNPVYRTRTVEPLLKDPVPMVKPAPVDVTGVDEARDRAADREVERSSERSSETRDERVDTARPREERYTGVIIDARGLGLDRSMSPKIRRKDGATVWQGANATPDYAIEEGIVSYVETMADARENQRAGSHPLIITALDRYEQPFPSDPLISDEDADYLLKAGAKDGFLKKFNVVFITGR